MRSKAFLILLVLLALIPAALGADAVLAVSSTEGGRVSVSGPIVIEGPGIYRTLVGAEITLLAVAEERWAFDRWISDEPAINGSTANPLTIRVNSTSIRITAAFRPLYEKVEFVRVFVSSPVPISYPEIVLKGRRVVISAPEVFVSKERDDIRYVFSAWILNGTVVRSSVVSFIATSNVNLTAVYRKEFKFMGEWFRIEEGVALQHVEHELAPGVIGKASCYWNLKLNVTLCATKGEVYVPKDLLPDFQPVYEKYYLVTIWVVGVPEAEVYVNGELHVAAPTKELHVKEGALIVDVQPRVGDYVLQGESSVVRNLGSPITLTFFYEFDPLSRFHPFLRSVGALILASPIGESVLSMPDPLPNILAIAPFAAVAAGSALSVRALAKRLNLSKRLRKERRKEEDVELDELVLRESPRQVGYSRIIEQTLGIGRARDPELDVIV
ncbi:MAG: InlB B-repeat-containing protein, partial [Candidatus Caldarchaeales archaeon]